MFTDHEIRVLTTYLSKQIDKGRVQLYRNVKRLNNTEFDKIVEDIKESSRLITVIEGQH
jgi:hypothetical protein